MVKDCLDCVCRRDDGCGLMLTARDHRVHKMALWGRAALIQSLLVIVEECFLRGFEVIT